MAWEVVAGQPPGDVIDSNFFVVNAADHTKTLGFNMGGGFPSTTTTLETTETVNRSFILPDISGTALVSDSVTGIVLVNQPTPLNGSNAGIQYATTTANRAQFLGGQYGNNTGTPGISTFKAEDLL